ncbi:SapB/AmfS family lanthipeptide [Streptomyces orinoci]
MALLELQALVADDDRGEGYSPGRRDESTASLLVCE